MDGYLEFCFFVEDVWDVVGFGEVEVEEEVFGREEEDAGVLGLALVFFVVQVSQEI